MLKLKLGDIVVREDGVEGRVSHVFGPDSVNVNFARDQGGACRTYDLTTNKHILGDLPKLSHIKDTIPVNEITTPYDTQIAAAEKALAELKAKAKAEAEAKAKAEAEAKAKAEAAVRWYETPEEIMAFIKENGYMVLLRRNGVLQPSGRPATNTNNKMELFSFGSNVTQLNFREYEFSTDGKTWKKLGLNVSA